MTIICKQNQKELRKITRRIEQLEAEMEGWIRKIKTSTEAMHSTNIAADLDFSFAKQAESTNFAQQEAVMEEWCQSRWNRWKILEKFFVNFESVGIR